MFRSPRTRIVVAVLCAVAFASAAATSWRSAGFIEADEISHLGYARGMHRDARLLVDVWGRPAVTLLHALPSHAGPFAVRLLSGLLAVVAALAAAALVDARRGRGRGEDTADLVVACTLAGPLVVAQASAIMTEIVFAALLGCGLAALRCGKPRLSALLLGALPLARPEGFWLGPVVAAWLFFARDAHPSPAASRPRTALLVLLATPLLVWWWAGLGAHREGLWFVTWWPRNWSAASIYGSGHWALFGAHLVAATTPWLWPATVAGAFRGFVEGLRLEITLALVVVVGHGAMFAAGVMGSAGYARYLATLAPITGAFAGLGLATLFERLRATPSVAAARAAAPLVVVATTLVFFRAPAIPAATDQAWIDHVAPLVKARLDAAPSAWLIADHPWAAVVLDRDPNIDAKPFGAAALELAPRGSVAVVETKFARRWGRIPGERVAEALATTGFERLPRDVVGDWTPPRDGAARDRELLGFEGDVWVKVR